MATLLFEIGTEELPAWYVVQGRRALVALAGERLREARLEHGAVTGFATPRRLTLRVDDVAERRERRHERRRGPSADVAFDAAGAPTKAAIGFARGQGVPPEALSVEETERGAYVFAELETGGEPAAELLPELLASLVRDLPADRKSVV